MATITKVCFIDIETLVFRVKKFTTAQKTKLTAIGITKGRIISVSWQPSATNTGTAKSAPTRARRIELIFRKVITNIKSSFSALLFSGKIRQNLFAVFGFCNENYVVACCKLSVAARNCILLLAKFFA